MRNIQNKEAKKQEQKSCNLIVICKKIKKLKISKEQKGKDHYKFVD